jgi:hypothetical protein
VSTGYRYNNRLGTYAAVTTKNMLDDPNPAIPVMHLIRDVTSHQISGSYSDKMTDIGR